MLHSWPNRPNLQKRIVNVLPTAYPRASTWFAFPVSRTFLIQQVAQSRWSSWLGLVLAADGHCMCSVSQTAVWTGGGALGRDFSFFWNRLRVTVNWNTSSNSAQTSSAPTSTMKNAAAVVRKRAVFIRERGSRLRYDDLL